MDTDQKRMLTRIIITLVSLGILNFISVSPSLKICLYICVYLLIGYDVLKKSIIGILKGKVFDENFLMTVATLGAFALSIYEKSGECNESVAVMLFYQIGELLQDFAVDRSKKKYR